MATLDHVELGTVVIVWWPHTALLQFFARSPFLALVPPEPLNTVRVLARTVELRMTPTALCHSGCWCTIS
jgi:hypothetical protein